MADKYNCHIRRKNWLKLLVSLHTNHVSMLSSKTELTVFRKINISFTLQAVVEEAFRY